MRGRSPPKTSRLHWVLRSDLAQERAHFGAVDRTAERRHRLEEERPVARGGQAPVEHRHDPEIGPRPHEAAGALRQLDRGAREVDCLERSRPARRRVRRRAACSGSFGRGNGMRSIVTSVRPTPATSTPVQKPIVANTATPPVSAVVFNRSTSWRRGASPWRSTSYPPSAPHRSAVARIAAHDVNKASVRPPAAVMSSCNSVAIASRYAGSFGSGRCLGT